MKSSTGVSLIINAPEFFADEAFLEWLNNGEAKFTWHTPGDAVGDYSDVVVLVDASLNGEGTDSDMPEHIWEQIVAECRKWFGDGKVDLKREHIHVRITNLG